MEFFKIAQVVCIFDFSCHLLGLTIGHGTKISNVSVILQSTQIHDEDEVILLLATHGTPYQGLTNVAMNWVCIWKLLVEIYNLNPMRCFIIIRDGIVLLCFNLFCTIIFCQHIFKIM